MAQRALYLRNPLLTQSLLGRTLIPGLTQSTVPLALGAQVAALHGQPLLVGGTAASIPQGTAAIAQFSDPTTTALFNQQAALGKYSTLIELKRWWLPMTASHHEINE